MHSRLSKVFILTKCPNCRRNDLPIETEYINGKEIERLIHNDKCDFCQFLKNKGNTVMRKFIKYRINKREIMIIKTRKLDYQKGSESIAISIFSVSYEEDYSKPAFKDDIPTEEFKKWLRVNGVAEIVLWMEENLIKNNNKLSS